MSEPPGDASTLDEKWDGRLEAEEVTAVDGNDKSDLGTDRQSEGDGPDADGWTPPGECCTNLADDDGDGRVDEDDFDCPKACP